MTAAQRAIDCNRPNIPRCKHEDRVANAAHEKELADQNALNDDKALLRFEFLMALVRLSLAKFCTNSTNDTKVEPCDVAGAVTLL